nr:Purine nucleotide synthesis repressor [Candidatus Pantoea persica]
MLVTHRQCQQLANGWRGQLSIAVDRIVKLPRSRQLVTDFYRHFPDIELHISHEVFNGVWDALADGRVDVAIGVTQAIPVGGRFAFRDMGALNWRYVVARGHPLTQQQPLIVQGDFEPESGYQAMQQDDDALRGWPSLVLEDNSRALPRSMTWTLDNQRRLVVQDWQAGLACVQMMPGHLARPLLDKGELAELTLPASFPENPCCVSWSETRASPALSWLLEYLGDAQPLNQEWLSEA